MSTDGLPAHLVMAAAEGEVAGMYCPSCGKDEAGKSQGGAYILQTGNLTKSAVAQLTQVITQGDPSRLIEITPRPAPSIDNIPADVLDAAAEALGNCNYDCSRTWTAWGYGTMGEGDFQLVAEQPERVAEIASAIITAWEQGKASPTLINGEPI